MRKVGWFLLLLVAIFFSRPLWEEYTTEYVDLSFLQPVDEWIESMEVGQYLNEAKAYWQEMKSNPTSSPTKTNIPLSDAGIELDQIKMGMKKARLKRYMEKLKELV